MKDGTGHGHPWDEGIPLQDTGGIIIIELDQGPHIKEIIAEDRQGNIYSIIS